MVWRSIFNTARLFNRHWVIVFLKYVFIRHNPLNDRSAEQDVAGIVERMVVTFIKIGRTVVRSLVYMYLTISDASVFSSMSAETLSMCYKNIFFSFSNKSTSML